MKVKELPERINVFTLRGCFSLVANKDGEISCNAFLNSRVADVGKFLNMPTKEFLEYCVKNKISFWLSEHSYSPQYWYFSYNNIIKQSQPILKEIIKNEIQRSSRQNMGQKY